MEVNQGLEMDSVEKVVSYHYQAFQGWEASRKLFSSSEGVIFKLYVCERGGGRDI